LKWLKGIWHNPAMNWLPEIKSYFESKQELLLRALADTRKAAADAPKPNESRSDTTINEKQKMINALETDLAAITKFIKIIPEDRANKSKVEIWSYVQTDKIKFILVPDGMGGGQVQDVRLISPSTPFGMAVINKKAGDTFVINHISSTIISVE
jgi:transcription elongation GreA/GreB family factor